MLAIREYRCVSSPEEALQLLDAGRKNRVIGGGMWLRLGQGDIATAIDLSRLGLEHITEADGEIHIGAMATLRDVEVSPCLRERFGGVLAQCVMPIVGCNSATWRPWERASTAAMASPTC